MEELNETLMFTVKVVAVSFVFTLIFVITLLIIHEVVENNKARRCAEYGYECKENQPRDDASFDAS